METPKRKRYQKDTAPADDIITLIQLVRQNPALYNYKLQPNQRRRIDVLNGWAKIAAQIGNKYSVEECRRKWKNLRDTYHQYRLRKPKVGDGLSKWRYAKELDFLSNVYQPKTKTQRQQSYDTMAQNNLLHSVQETSTHADMVHHAGITLVNTDAETFILTAYEESVNDDVDAINHHGAHDDPSMSQMELTHDDNVEDVVEIVKNEHVSLEDDDGAEVGYEEVCMYEESGNAQTVDCETIIGSGVVRSASTDSKEFQYIDTNDFCIGPINTQLHHSNSNCSGSSAAGIINSTKLKNVICNTSINNTCVVTSPITTISCVSSGAVNEGVNPMATTSSTSIMKLDSPIVCGQTREELDLFFDFLKKKMQRFPKEEITAIQVEFLNCVLRREAEQAHKNNNLTITQ